jgi:hypothetical protein
MASSVQNPIDIAEGEIRRDREDLDRLKRRYPGYDFLPSNNGSSASAAAAVVTQRATIYPRPIASLSAIEQAILSTVDSEPNEEWTSRGIIMRIRSNGSYRLANNEDAALNAVGIALASLVEKERILRSHEGRGRDPHRYTSILSTEKEVPSEEKTS